MFFNDKLDYLIDWLVDRRHFSKDWNERSMAIRAKIQQAIFDMPALLKKRCYKEPFLRYYFMNLLKF